MARKKKATIGQYISGKVFANEDFIHRLPIIAYVGLLMMIYMGNHFSIQAKYEYMDKLTTQIKTLRTISVTASEQRMARSQQSEVEKQLERFKIDLQKSTELPHIIE